MPSCWLKLRHTLICVYLCNIAGPRARNLSAWLSGWFNLLGNVGSTAGVAYTSAVLIRDYVSLATGAAAAVSSAVETATIYCVVVLLPHASAAGAAAAAVAFVADLS